MTIVRHEVRADQDGVRRAIEAAFARPDEAALVDRLRSDGDVAIGQVAIDGGAVVGCAFWSRLRAPFPALALAPVAVVPARQRKGVGGQLIRAGLRAARDEGWILAVVLGDPGYYEGFGFERTLAQRYATPYGGPHLMALALDGAAPPGCAIAYPAAFGALA